jgi:hypothetical protein
MFPVYPKKVAWCGNQQPSDLWAWKEEYVEKAEGGGRADLLIYSSVIDSCRGSLLSFSLSSPWLPSACASAPYPAKV